MIPHRFRFTDPVAALLFLSFIAACQPTPEPSPSAPTHGPAAEQSLTNSPEGQVDVAKTSEEFPDALPATPPLSRKLPESYLSAPEKDLASRQLAYNTTIRTRAAETTKARSWHYRRTNNGQIVGFEFSNHGGNPILPPRRDASKNQFFGRDFQFRFDDRARQDIYLMVSDWVPSRDHQFRLSELMNTLIHFFPRNYLPAIVGFNGKTLITLPTGEEVEFNAQTNEILGGALWEGSVDLNPDRDARNFPAIAYNGRGVVVRANSRGADPRIGTAATISNGSPAPTCDKGAACRQCQVPAHRLWDQNGALRFKFATDQEFDRFLRANCEFGLPKTADGYALSSVSTKDEK